MRKIIQSYLFILLFLLNYGNGIAQHEVGYGQYMFNGSLINPAFCGSNGVLNATLTYKNQWTGFGAAPKTIALGLNSPLKNEALNVGLLIINDKFGITNKSRYLAAYAHRIKLNNKLNLRFGLQAGFETIRNDYDKLTIIESGDASFTDIKSNYAYFTSGAGVYLHSNRFFAGLSSPVLLTSALNGSGSYKPMFIYSGMKFKLNTNFSIQPSLLFKYIKHSPLQFDINTLLMYKEKIGLGLSYRTSKTINCNLFYQLNSQLFLGYAIDLNTGKLSKLAATSHEVIIKYLFGYSKDVQNPKTFF